MTMYRELRRAQAKQDKKVEREKEERKAARRRRIDSSRFGGAPPGAPRSSRAPTRRSIRVATAREPTSRPRRGRRNCGRGRNPGRFAGRSRWRPCSHCAASRPPNRPTTTCCGASPAAASSCRSVLRDPVADAFGRCPAARGHARVRRRRRRRGGEAAPGAKAAARARAAGARGRRLPRSARLLSAPRSIGAQARALGFTPERPLAFVGAMAAETERAARGRGRRGGRAGGPLRVRSAPGRSRRRAGSERSRRRHSRRRRAPPPRRRAVHGRRGGVDPLLQVGDLLRVATDASSTTSTSRPSGTRSARSPATTPCGGRPRSTCATASPRADGRRGRGGTGWSSDGWSGDRFVVESGRMWRACARRSGRLREMEGAAARRRAAWGVPWAIVRSISDTADHAHVDFRAFTEVAAARAVAAGARVRGGGRLTPTSAAAGQSPRAYRSTWTSAAAAQARAGHATGYGTGASSSRS